jgi:PAS domain S-box-containing protein
MDFFFKHIVISAPITLIVAIATFTVATLGIQARRKAEHYNLQLNAILSSLIEGIIVIDREHRIMLMNQAAGVLFRTAPSEALHKKIEKTIFFDSEKSLSTKKRFGVSQIINQVIKQQEIIRTTNQDRWYGKDKQGHIFYFSMIASPLVESGKTTGAVLVIQNVATEKQYAYSEKIMA